jgi:hypothetical protein
LDDIAGEHYISPVEPIEIDARDRSDEYRGEKNSGDSDPDLEQITCKLEDIPYRGYIEYEVA